ncbi:hypothetical protein BpHYR1_032210 [Brachionus plicatilis]|uniref:MULE transposase domain-containing protein n=1 Tax=Brachionus plicatilis TaxID=10195 RepID=A0A3M7Q7C0_BRAPC|nr:hypothetical protein BpHYR1_032210 [Brachionus plicatilis]
MSETLSKESSFEDFDVILKEIKDGKINGNTWIFKSQDGNKHRFYCKYLKHGCRAALYLQLTDGSKGNCFISDDEHTNHPNDEKDIRKIDPIIYQKIVEYENFGQKPEAIITNLIKAGMQPPKKTKINLYILKNIRKAKKVSNQPTMNDLKEWCDQYNEIPEHDDQVFGAEYEYQAFPEQKFRVLLTTKRLIRNTLDTKYILSDAIYKLFYGGFPALTGGTIDKNKNFHPFGLALCSSENNFDFAFFFRALKSICFRVIDQIISPSFLVADSAEAITIGFKKVFETSKVVNCWAHVIRNSDKRLNHFVLPIKKEIRQDIKTIQKLFREDLFVYATQLFQKKWQEEKSQSINEFIDYFFSEWVDKNNGWYEGYVEGICFPSTSNGIESSHDKIKTALNRKRLGARAEIIKTIDPDTNEPKDLVNLNLKKFHSEPIIENDDLLDAHDWNKFGKTIQHVDDYYMVRDGNEKKIVNCQECKQYLQRLQNKPWKKTYRKRIAPKESIEEPIVIKKSKSTLLNDSLDDIDDDLKVKDTQITFSMSFKDGPGDLAKSGTLDI